MLRRNLLVMLVSLVVIALCGFTLWLGMTSLFTFTAQLPDTVGMNVRADVTFGELSKHSLLTITACHDRKVVTVSEGSQYSVGEPVAIHIMPETTIWDRRGRWFAVASGADMLQPGQTIVAQMQDVPVMLGEGVTAASITIIDDGKPEPCDLHWLMTPSTVP